MEKKRNYSKPSAQYIDIITNDLCAGSVCTTIDLTTIQLQEMKTRNRTYTIKNGSSENMWDSSF